jgi:lysophospholipase L1-like esterase
MACIDRISLIRSATAIVIACLITCLIAASSARAQSAPSPAYVAVGDSIEFGLGDDNTADGIGYVPSVAAFLSSVLGIPVAVHNFGEPFADTRDIIRTQVPDALGFLNGHSPGIVSWGGGGNDLAEVATGPQSAACRQSKSCLGRFNGLLNEIEQTIDRTIARLREGVGPSGRILMRTQYNALARVGCASPEVVALGNITLEGLPGTVLNRGLNDRIRSVAAKYDAQVVDLFVPFAVNAATFISSDCIHPSGVGYQAIAMLSSAAFLAGS